MCCAVWLPQPTTQAELDKLKPKPSKRSGAPAAYPFGHPKNTKMAAMYKGKDCCGGDRVWGMEGLKPYTFIDDRQQEWAVFCCGACRQPLPLVPPAAAAAPPAAERVVQLAAEQRAAIEASQQAALARRASARAAREEEERRARFAEQEAWLALADAHAQTVDWAEKREIPCTKVQFVDQADHTWHKVLQDVD